MKLKSIGGYDFVCGASETVLKTVKEIDIVITSPPYKDSDGFCRELIQNVFAAVYKAMNQGGLLFVNFGHLAEDKFRPFWVALAIEQIGFTPQETFTWMKNHYKPIQGQRRVNNLTEFVFMFSKGPMPVLDRLAVGVPYADKSNVGRYAEKDLRCAGNLWEIPYETITKSEQKMHNDRFPVGLPLNCLKIAGNGPVRVLDCFAGSNTTAVACKRLGIKYCLCVEKNPVTYEFGLKRVKDDFKKLEVKNV